MGIVNYIDLTINKINDQEIDDFLSLYISAFPKEERREWGSVSDVLQFCRSKAELFNILSITVSNKFAGFITYWRFAGYIYVEHFAVVESMRSRKIGYFTMRHVMEHINPNILLEVELPTDDLTTRRVRFYEKLGFKAWQDIDYLQPPYSDNLPATPLVLMSSGDIVLQSSEDDVIRGLKRVVYRYDESQL